MLEREEMISVIIFVFQAEDGIRDLGRSGVLGDVYKRQDLDRVQGAVSEADLELGGTLATVSGSCLLYTSDSADERSSVDLGGSLIIKKKKRANKKKKKICYSISTPIRNSSQRSQ